MVSSKETLPIMYRVIESGRSPIAPEQAYLKVVSQHKSVAVHMYVVAT